MTEDAGSQATGLPRLHLEDTRTRARVPPAQQTPVQLYVCGITPYDSTHLGHAYTYVQFDALVRYLEATGHGVRYVRNITDVDDDILAKARELDEHYLDLAARELARFERDLDGLACRKPDVEPRATETIPQIREAVQALLDTGNAYALADGRVYFDIASAPRFGVLSRLDRGEMLRQFAEKGGDPEARGKRDALDFLLWQPSEPDEPAWDSAWGPGRPGWHIECSAMATTHLGLSIDVHGGGSDLIFPHHEAELVQAEHATGAVPFSRCWAHVGMVGLDGVKMSKSLGNLVFVSDLLERHEAGGVRRYLLGHHYRGDWDHDERELAEADAAFKRWQDAAGGSGQREDLVDRFHAAVADDLDLGRAMAVLDEAADNGAGETLADLAAMLGFDLG